MTDAGAPQQIIVHQREPSTLNLTCPKLASTNYNTWTVMMEANLDAQGLWEAVDPVTGEAVDEKKNKLARAIIYQALLENVLMQVATTRSAKDIWEALRVRYLGADRVQQARLATLRRELEQLKIGEKESVEEFAGKVSEFVSKFIALGTTLEETTIVKKLLDSMPPKFITIIATIEQFSDLTTMTFEECIGRLKAFEERIKGHEAIAESDGKLLYTQVKPHNRFRKNDQDRRGQGGRGRGMDQRGRGHGRSRGNGRGRGNYHSNDNRGNYRSNDNRNNDRSNDNLGNDQHRNNTEQGRETGNRGRDKQGVRCYNCNTLGHYAWECTKTPENEANLNQTEERGPALMMASTDEVLLNEEKVYPKLYANSSHDNSIWYLDNGASNHMTGTLSHFTELDKRITGRSERRSNAETGSEIFE
ncbi:uncharacterized protein LOC110933325 [Helianthus annuus]|uniref:uncharacterized protein LOC110933325 n=1 Tax=Helianthus annuus TaxID=4232 RepID=UPI000B8FCF3A|nr:uncharacterized protein LOC110933325 [Helianthus annuus]